MGQRGTCARLLKTFPLAKLHSPYSVGDVSVIPTLEDILGRGYLPLELPPPFNSVSFGIFARTIRAPKLPFDTSTKGFRTSRPETYNLARAGSFRRELSIMNPIHFGELALCVVTNWPEIEKLTKSALSLTSPIATSEGRAISANIP